jgi:serine phosphatase RsbU (regulator of sigma subunit)
VALLIEALFVFRPFILKLNTNTKALLATNEELHQKQTEVLSQAEELQQQNEEVLIIQEQLETHLVELERQHDAINASIRYARTIQEAVLPHIPRIKSFFKDAFVVYKPQHIVSGDFFWFKALEEQHILAVGDCTGHGVPGAFMSLLGMSFLDFIVTEDKNPKPDFILEQMNFLVIKNLKQSQTENQEGMEILHCQFEGEYLKFAASKRPLYIIPPNGKLETYKGTRRYIGITKALQEPHFKVHELPIKPNTMLYLTSDGLQDQPNPQRKRFGSKKLKKLLSEISEKPVKVQKQKVEEAFEAHKQDAWQVDDLTLLGVRT